MSELTDFIGQAWHDHAEDARGVADRLPQALALPADDAGLAGLIGLAHHVHGEHLGAWQEGLDYIGHVRALSPFAAQGSSGGAAQRAAASLRLCAGLADERAALSVSDQVRVTAMAAGNLAAPDAARAATLLQQACAAVETSTLIDTDPALRSLAASANGIACTMEARANRNAAETALMVAAAQAARTYWARAGTWLETERAEYRLAMSCTQAGQLPRARGHAQACLAIVAEHDHVALEQFFGFEALAVVERAAGDLAAFGRAVEGARTAFARLTEDDRSGCQATLDKLLTATPPPP